CFVECRTEVRVAGFQTQTQPAGQKIIVLGLAPVQEKVVVTATRTETPTEQVGASVAVISGEQIEQQQQLLAGDVLRQVPGLTVIRSGGLGPTTSVFPRGGNFDYDLSYDRLNTDNEIPNNDFRDSTGSANFGLSLGRHTQLRWISRGDSTFTGTPGQVAFGQPDIPSILDSYFRKADGYTGFSI